MLPAPLGAALPPDAPTGTASPTDALAAGPAGPGDPVAEPPGRHLPVPPGTTRRVSLRPGGGDTTGFSTAPSISGNGRWVAFVSAAPGLVPGDEATSQDAFVWDRSDRSIVRLPLPGGEPIPPGGRAFEPAISNDGSVVAFTYRPPQTGTIAGPPPSLVLAWDRATGETTVVSVNIRGAPTGPSSQPSVSGDGRLVAFTSGSAQIVAGDSNGQPDVFLADRSGGPMVLVSAGTDGGIVDGRSDEPSISVDGRFVAFSSVSPALVEGAGGGRNDIFVRDLAAGTTEWVSVDRGGGPPDRSSGSPSISGDGRLVAFDSGATDLVDGDTNDLTDVFVRDRQAGTTTLVSTDLPIATDLPDTDPGPHTSPSISANGRVVAFVSGYRGLEGRAEIYAHDRAAGDTIRVSEARGGGPGGGQGSAPAVNGNGRFIAFASDSGDLVAGDGNDATDVFLRDLPPAPTLAPAQLDFGSRTIGTTGPAAAATLSNVGWTAVAVQDAAIVGGNASDFAIALDGCSGQTVRRLASCTVSVTFTPSAPGPRGSTLRVRDSAAGSPRTVRLVGGASQVRLELDPPMGPPGFVTYAVGSGFPAGAQVALDWSIGIDERRAPVVADADGAFRVPVLVFHNDVEGPRELVATPAGGPSFPQTTAPFDVTRPTAVPPRFDVSRVLGEPPDPFVFRR